MNDYQYLNERLKDGAVIITNKTLFLQDFQTRDEKYFVTSQRVGGGFTVGTTQYKLNGVPMTLTSIYRTIASYLRGKEIIL